MDKLQGCPMDRPPTGKRTFVPCRLPHAHIFDVPHLEHGSRNPLFDSLGVK